ncbi:cleavage stimulation factor subunit 1-like [Metopolophium dirhodum]|uniref:cleavage stimulation factor subunit 1-like n=1 Tax=Metopolophium dirhodum TaxID=44670 RepID=UPI00298FBC5E|nr:cleavage stimulation factor subunit 1-like [Metopolophium dirhodum]
MRSDINNGKPEMYIKNRDHLYRLNISQLFYDGHSTIASSLAALVNADPPCSPSDRLMSVVTKGLQHETDRQKESKQALNLNPIQQMLIGPGIEFETDVICTALEPPLYETVYVTSHKGACRAGAFSSDGQLIAIGSSDASKFLMLKECWLKHIILAVLIIKNDRGIQ